MATFIVTTNIDESYDNGDLTAETNDGNGLSLREAIGLANANAGADTILFDASVFTGGASSLIRLTLGTELEITDTVTIDGDLNDDGMPDIVITADALGNDILQADDLTTAFDESVLTDVAASLANDPARLDTDNTRIFNSTDPGADVTLVGLVLTGGRTTAVGAEGGAVLTSGDLMLIDSIVSGNSTADADGGGISVGGEATVSSSTISANAAGGAESGGGGLFSEGPVTISGSTISGNTATGLGGGIGGYDSDITITDSQITNNTVTGNDAGGGGVGASDGAISIYSSTISGNRVEGTTSTGAPDDIDAEGGGVRTTQGNILIVDSVVTGNSASIIGQTANPDWDLDVEGGGVRAVAGDITILNSTVSNNTAEVRDNIGAAGTNVDAEGGGVRTVQGDILIVDSVVTGNTLRVENQSDVGNIDAEGGGVRAGGGSITIIRGTIEDNVVDVTGTATDENVDVEGGGVRNSSGDIVLVDSSVSNNLVQAIGNTVGDGFDVEGGGVRSSSGDILLLDVTVSNNLVQAIGGTVGDSLEVEGGGVRNSGGATTAINSTIAHNALLESVTTVTETTDVEGGGLRTNEGDVTLTNTTVTGNYAGPDGLGGGIAMVDAGGTATFANSLVLGNNGSFVAGLGNTGDVFAPLAITEFAGNNVVGLNLFDGNNNVTPVGATAAEVAQLVFDETIDFVDLDGDGVQDADEPTLGTDVEAGVLADNGGSLKTVALRRDTTNPALDSGTDALAVDNDGAPLLTDARGEIRILNGAVDLGAFELQNAPPVAADDMLRTDEDTAISGDLTADNGNGPDSDPDSDTLSVYLVNGQLGAVDSTTTLPSGALLTVFADGRYLYHPNGAFDHLALGETAIDSFTYAIFDGNGGVDSATATVTIDGVNDAPDAVDDDFATDKDSGVFGNVLADNGNGADSDPDGGTSLIVTHVNGSAAAVGSQILLPSGALLMLNADGSFLYGTNGAFEALGDDESFADSFTYTIGDGDGGSDGATATVTIDGGNEAPVAADDALATDEDTAITGNVFSDNGNGPDSDANGDALTVSAVNGAAAAVGNEIMLPSGARLTLNSNGSFVYDPMGAFDDLSPGEADTDGFTYTTTDGKGGSATATVSIGIDGLTDVIRGTPQEDDLTGTDGDDLIYALASDDIIDPRGGSHMIDGGSGTDTVVYATTRSVFDVDLMEASGFTVGGESAALVGGNIVVERPDGETDTLIDVERIDFTDGDLIYDIDSPNVEVVYRMYAAALGRTPDETGLRYWVDRLDFLDDLPGSTADSLLQVLADVFIEADEFEMLYGSDPSNADYIDAMYQNVLGRLPDEEGRAFWIDAMERGLERDDILIAFSESAENRDQTGPDLDDGIWVI